MSLPAAPSTTRRPEPRLTIAAGAIAAIATTLVCLPSAPGIAGLGGLVLLLGTLIVACAGLLIACPPLLVALVPALIPSPMFLLTFAWEVALVVLAALIALHGWRVRAGWLHRLGSIERALVLFTVWALFSGFWSDDTRYYLIGARRLLMGLCALWVASRLPAIASRRWFDVGLIAGAGALALSAGYRSMTSGLSSEQALLHRSSATDLGWGTANYVATLLLLFSPSLLRLVLRGRPVERTLASISFVLAFGIQLVIASRAATILFIIGALVQLLRVTRRFRMWVAAGFAAAIAVILMSPLGYGFMSRFDNLRELGSMTIRLWYFREGWARLLEHLPWGMGLWQGYGNADHLQGIDPHNYWLLIGGDLGLPGVALWITVLVAITRRWWATRRDEASREEAHTLLLTLVLANLHTLVEPTLQGAHYQLLFFWVLCGTLAYSESGAGVGRASPEPAAPRGVRPAGSPA